MWSGRIIAAAVGALAAGCASLPPPEERLDAQVTAILEQRGLGAQALLVIDNLMRNGPPAPRAAPALVQELFARPLDALDAAAIFRRVVPASLAGFTPASPLPFADLLQTYAEELASAQRLLQEATRPFDEELLLRQLQQGLPAPDALLALADALDPEKLRQANDLFIDATVRFARRLSGAESIPEGKVFDLGFGRIVIGTRGSDVHEVAPARGGKVSIIIDPGGDDEYRGSDLALHGFSAIIDLAGNDRYRMDGPGLGAALAGASLLIDFAGNDAYEAKFFAQGAAAFGFGALLDLGGDDRYRVEAWGQGFGIGGGTGLLWDRAGNDRYLAGGVPDPFNRAGGLSGAQGASFGHRGRLAGGVGILRDDSGDDSYEAQMFAQGLGYYYGVGLLWDRGGNDQYRALQYAQGNGVHQAIGVLREESGDDRYELAVFYGQGMGHDVAFGALVDDAGNDDYRARDAAQGSATANGIGLLADRNGADRFTSADGIQKWGYAEWRRGLPTVALLLHGASAQFTANGQSTFPREPPLAVEPMSPTVCPSRDPGEALLCGLKDAADVDAHWRELRPLAESPLAGWVAIALRERPPSREQADEIAALLAARESCNVRALALRAWPTLPAAEAALRSSCFRLQSAGAAAFARLGVALPPDAPLPAFLRRIPPQEDTY